MSIVAHQSYNANLFEIQLNAILFKMKRNSKREQSIESVRYHNCSITTSSSTKFHPSRKNTLPNLSKGKHLIQLPKIYPIHNVYGHKKYQQTRVFEGDLTANIFINRLLRRKSKQKYHNDSKQETIQIKHDRTLLERHQSFKQIFLEQILCLNGISEIYFSKREKLKVYIEQGNNSRLINQLIRRRINLKIVSSRKDANLIWTQFCDWQQANLGSSFTQAEDEIRQKQRELTQDNIRQSQNYYRSSFYPLMSNLNNKMEKSNRQICINEFHLHNHLKNHFQISDKKCLLKNIKKYCKSQRMSQNQVIPRTYHIQGNNFELPNLDQNQKYWIIKPGQDTNRGHGISVQQGHENIIKAVKELISIGKSALIQEYIDPLLHKNRKFDIRCYALVTSIGGNLRAYWYKEGYLRTCCKEFTYDPTNIYGHLTNDAVQKNHKDYGKYEPYNKLSFAELQAILKGKQLCYQQTINRMKELAIISIKSAEDRLKGEKNMFAFEVFGYDFLIDSKGKLWLIEINTNPCLEFAGSLLSRIIWHMMENSIAIAIDPFLMKFPEPFSTWRQKTDKIFQDNKFQCII